MTPLFKAYKSIYESKEPTFVKVNNMKDISGSGLRGFIKTTFQKLVDTFGEPAYGSGDDKVKAKWILTFSDGSFATIYDYKEPEVPKDEYDWHIGGRNVPSSWFTAGVPGWEKMLQNIAQGNADKPSYVDDSMLHPHLTYLEWEDLPAGMKRAILRIAEEEADQNLVNTVSKLLGNAPATTKHYY
jgi:hypothetical protein